MPIANEPNRRHPTGQHEGLFRRNAQRLRQLFKAGVPVIAVGESHFRIEGGLPQGWVWEEGEEE